MKQSNVIILSIFVIFSSVGCSSHAPSLQNKTTAVKEKQGGFLQKKLDSWLVESWEPDTQEVEEKYKEDKSFKLQKYVEKMELYAKKHPLDINSSHYKKLEHLPVIGK